MDWDLPLQLTRNVFLQLLGMQSYAARASFTTDRGVSLDAGSLALLSCFTEPCSVRQARAALGDTVSSTDEDFAATVEVLIGHGLLRDPRTAQGAGAPVLGSGYAQLQVHHEMLLDAVRVDAYRLAIARLAPGRRVLEIGAGTGVLSIFAARYGAAKVVAVEESGIVALAQALAQANGVSDRIEFVVSNSLDYRPEQRAELIIHELIGHEPLAEHALRYLEDARRRLLAPGGTMIPSALEIHCRAVGRAGWNDPRVQRAQAEQLALRYGLAFEPYQEILRNAPSLPSFHRDVACASGGTASEDTLLYQVDFSVPIAEQKLSQPVEVQLPVLGTGFVNALIVHFRARMADDLWLSNAPEAPRTHWALAVYDLPAPIAVTAGQQLTIRSRLEPIDGVERTLIEVVHDSD